MGERGDGGDQVRRRPGVGVGVVVLRGREVLLVRRRYHGAGSWATPGGYLDPGEAFETCAMRETEEKTGLRIAVPRVVAVANDLYEDGKHNVTVWLVAQAEVGEVRVASDELDAVAWFPWDALPDPLYQSTANFFGGRAYPCDAWRQLLNLPALDD